MATELAAEFNVTLEVALHQVKRVNYQHCHNGKIPHRGQTPDTTAHIGPGRCAWLKAQGGKAQTIKRLIDEAMHVGQAVRDLAAIMAEDKLVKIP